MTALLNRLSRFFLVLLMVLGGVVSAFSQHENEPESAEDLNVSDLIIHHVLDDHVWHFADGMVLNLPIIVYSAEKGLDVFSSGNFYDEHHNVVPYKGYVLDHNNIYLEGTEKKVLDLSIYSTYCDCLEMEVGEEARQLLKQAS